MHMNFDDYLAALQSDTLLLAAAASQAGADAPVVTCPGWTIRDLVLHIGEVQRWCASMVRNRVTNPSKHTEDFLGVLPSDTALIDWFVDGSTALVATLKAADVDLDCFTFLEDAGTPRDFWARRQANEIAIHRVDAESALGRNGGIPARHASDGIDELLMGFAPRSRTPLRSAVPVVLQVAPFDSDSAWRVRITDQPAVTTRGFGDADCSVSGSSSDVYQSLWNRQGSENLTVSGDASVLELFREKVQIRWG